MDSEQPSGIITRVIILKLFNEQRRCKAASWNIFLAYEPYLSFIFFPFRRFTGNKLKKIGSRAFNNVQMCYMYVYLIKFKLMFADGAGISAEKYLLQI